MLHLVPLLAVASRREVGEAKELVAICKEYHVALRCELKRKEQRDEDAARSAELAAYFTHCNLQGVHLALSLRSAMTIFFKLKNFATCATFCRRLLELNPGQKVRGFSVGVSSCADTVRASARWFGIRCRLLAASNVSCVGRVDRSIHGQRDAPAHTLPHSAAAFNQHSPPAPPLPQIADQARQVLAACEKTPTDTVQVRYDTRNPFDICSLTFTPIYRGSKYVEDPYTGARFQPECAGQLSPLGDIVRIGADASGLLISATQVR